VTDLERVFLEGERLKWYEIRALYRHYKSYVAKVTDRVVEELDISPAGDVIMWNFVLNGGSVIVPSGGRMSLKDSERFTYATLLGELEFWFYRLRNDHRDLSTILFLRDIKNLKPREVAEELEWEGKVSDAVRQGYRIIAKMRNSLISTLLSL
jgi:hypothetical protein